MDVLFDFNLDLMLATNKSATVGGTKRMNTDKRTRLLCTGGGPLSMDRGMRKEEEEEEELGVDSWREKLC